MKSFVRTPILATLALTIALAAPSRGDALKPASLLLYPEFNNQAGSFTMLTITNVAGAASGGSIDVHLIYVDAATCLRNDRIEHLTARDTVTFVTAFQAPGLTRGYMYAYALDPITHKAIDFDNLIGDSLRLDGVNAGFYTISPIPFQGLTGPGVPTDVNANGKPDLNGIEYEKAHNHCFLPRFFGQFTPPGPNGIFLSELILLQPLANAGVTTSAGFLVYNDNEEVYSADYSFQCWTRVPLLSISGAFAQAFLSTTANNPNEVEGASFIESGWFDIKGTVASSSQGSTQNPPILGVLVDIRPDVTAELPFVDNP
jgi:hypothetical protein